MAAGLPQAAAHSQLASAVDAVVHLARGPGRRPPGRRGRGAEPRAATAAWWRSRRSPSRRRQHPGAPRRRRARRTARRAAPAMRLVAVVLAGVSVALARPRARDGPAGGRARPLRTRLLGPGRAWSWRWPASSAVWSCWSTAPGSLLALVLGGMLLAVGVLVRRGRVPAAAARRQALVVDVCEALVGELRAGQPPVAGPGALPGDLARRSSRSSPPPGWGPTCPRRCAGWRPAPAPRGCARSRRPGRSRSVRRRRWRPPWPRSPLTARGAAEHPAPRPGRAGVRAGDRPARRRRCPVAVARHVGRASVATPGTSCSAPRSGSGAWAGGALSRSPGCSGSTGSPRAVLRPEDRSSPRCWRSWRRRRPWRPRSRRRRSRPAGALTARPSPGRRETAAAARDQHGSASGSAARVLLGRCAPAGWPVCAARCRLLAPHGTARAAVGAPSPRAAGGRRPARRRPDGRLPGGRAVAVGRRRADRRGRRRPVPATSCGRWRPGCGWASTRPPSGGTSPGTRSSAGSGAAVVPRRGERRVGRGGDDRARRGPAAQTARADVETRARAVGVKAVVPLGVCLLPAFVLVGVVPLVAGLARRAGRPLNRSGGFSSTADRGFGAGPQTGTSLSWRRPPPTRVARRQPTRPPPGGPQQGGRHDQVPRRPAAHASEESPAPSTPWSPRPAAASPPC